MDRLEVRLGEVRIGLLTLLSGDRSFFAFDEAYLRDPQRAVLSQSFLTPSGEVIPETKIVQTKLPAFFSNLLPEGHLRHYLANRGGVKAAREFKLIELLGDDLPGAVTVKPLQGSVFGHKATQGQEGVEREQPLRFSLAGVQLKFSALAESDGGLTISASGVDGDWIIKLPAQNFPHVPENEWSMLHLARHAGIPVPETRLVSLSDIAGLPELGILSGQQALATKRFDRAAQGKRIHIEDFAQVYQLFPGDKYNKVSYANIANMVWTLTGEDGLVDFIRRLVFTLLIGNGDMHLKNWSFIYADSRTPQLAPAYDFVSTIPYIPNDKLALSLSGEKEMGKIAPGHFKKLTKKAGLPEYLVLNTLTKTIEAVFEAWHAHKMNYPLPQEICDRIEKHMQSLMI